MPLWFFPTLLALCSLVCLGSAIWLLLNLASISRMFSGNADVVASRDSNPKSRSAIWTALVLFNAGWIGALIIWMTAFGDTASNVS